MDQRSRIKVRNLLRFSVLIVSLGSVMMMISLYNPIMPHILSDFSNHSNPLLIVQLIITAPTLSIIIASIFISFVLKEMPFIKQVSIGLMTFGLAGFSAIFFTKNANVLILLRTLVGIGSAFVYSGCYGIAKTLPRKKRVFFFSINMVSTELLGIVFVVLSSYITVRYGWQKLFVIYLTPLTVLPFFYIVFRTYTRGPFIVYDDYMEGEAKGTEVFLYRTNYIWFVSVIFGILVFWLLNATFQINIAQFLNQRDIYTTKNASTLLSINLIFGLLGNIINNKSSEKLGYSYNSILSTLGFAFSLISFNYFHTMNSYFVISAIAGTFIGIFTANTSPWILSAVSIEKSQIAVNMVTICTYIGYFSSPFVLNVLRKFITAGEIYALLGIIAILYTIYMLIVKKLLHIKD